MKRKRLFTLAWLCIAGSCMVKAQTWQTVLVVQMVSGSTQSFYLAERPEVTFSGKDMMVQTSRVDMSFLRTDISDFHFKKTNTGVHPLEKDELRMVFTNDNEVSLYGLTETDRPIILYDIGGKACLVETAMSGSQVTINISNLSKGVYIIKIGNKSSIKITRK